MIIKRIYNVTTTLFVAVFVILAILLAGVRFIGFTPFAVLSGSMTPLYKPGDLVYVRESKTENIKAGDVITFLIGDDTVVTHRVARVSEDNKLFYTKGDANENEDGQPVDYRNVIGKVSFSVPKLGYLSEYIKTTTGKYVTISVLCFLIILFILPEFFKKKDNRK